MKEITSHDCLLLLKKFVERHKFFEFFQIFSNCELDKQDMDELTNFTIERYATSESNSQFAFCIAVLSLLKSKIGSDIEFNKKISNISSNKSAIQSRIALLSECSIPLNSDSNILFDKEFMSEIHYKSGYQFKKSLYSFPKYTDLEFLTIDKASTCYFDDAFALEATSRSLKLYFAVPDVEAYIPMNSEFADKIFLKSYFGEMLLPDIKRHMSLSEGNYRKAIVFSVSLDNNLKPIINTFEIQRRVIKVKRNLIGDDIKVAFNYAKNNDEFEKYIISTIKQMAMLYATIEFDTRHSRYFSILNFDKKMLGLPKKVDEEILKELARRIIAAFNQLANYSISIYCKQNNIPLIWNQLSHVNNYTTFSDYPSAYFNMPYYSHHTTPLGNQSDLINQYNIINFLESGSSEMSERARELYENALYIMNNKNRGEIAKQYRPIKKNK